MNEMARALGPLVDRVVFLGGAAAGLLIDDPAASAARPTTDADCLAELGTQSEFHRFEKELLERRFRPDHDQLGRYRHKNLVLDVILTEASFLGAPLRWGKEIFSTATSVVLDRAPTIRLITAPYFVATKLVAFLDPMRGNGDALASHDFEDIVLVTDGRSRIVEEIRQAPAEVREFIANTLGSLNDTLDEIVSAHLDRDLASQARVNAVVEKFRAMIAAATGS